MIYPPAPPLKKRRRKEDKSTNKKQTKASEEKKKKTEDFNKTTKLVILFLMSIVIYSDSHRIKHKIQHLYIYIYMRTIMISNNCENHSTFYILDKNNTGHLPLIQLSVLLRLCYLSFPSKTWGLGSLYLQIMTS